MQKEKRNNKSQTTKIKMKHKFNKGESGNPNGRPKGSKNGIKFEVAQILADKGCNPFQILADLAMKSKHEKIRADCSKELAQYVAPKLKQIEHTGNAESPVQFLINLGESINNPLDGITRE